MKEREKSFYLPDAWEETRKKYVREFTQLYEPDAYGYVVKRTLHDNALIPSSRVEEDLQAELLCRLSGRLFDGKPHVVEIKSETERVPDGLEIRYRAEVREVKVETLRVPMWQYKPWEREPLPFPSTGKNHRKKDRARARYRRKQREKLRREIRELELRQIIQRNQAGESRKGAAE